MNNLLPYKSIIGHLLKPVLLALVFALSLSVHAEDVTLCAPFKNAQIDQSKLTMMLNAAKDGDLYRIKPGTSKMGFCVNSPVGVIKAEFHDFKGGLALKETKEQGSVMVNIAVDSLKVDSAIIGAMLKGESFFDSEQFPNIVFISSGFEWLTDKRAVLKGDLTMHGVTKVVAFYVDLEKVKTVQGEEVITVKATTAIQRSEFNMHTLNPLVDDRVSLCMTIDTYKHKT
ncbi:MAG: YceI family protein [Gammaproteobacteria bacterium]